MAQSITTKDRAGSRERARQAKRRGSVNTDRQSRGARSRSRANDERKAQQLRGVNPRAWRSAATTVAVNRGRPAPPANVPKNKRDRAAQRKVVKQVEAAVE